LQYPIEKKISNVVRAVAEDVTERPTRRRLSKKARRRVWRQLFVGLVDEDNSYFFLRDGNLKIFFLFGIKSSSLRLPILIAPFQVQEKKKEDDVDG